MRDEHYEVIVIGGGMAGAHAAWPLVEAGKRVLMLDGGVTASFSPHRSVGDFIDVRKSDERQHELFLGSELEALLPASRASHASSMASGNRSHVSRYTDEQLPLNPGNAQIIQSLAKGGLSEAWGGVCAVLDAEELSKLGINTDMHSHYQAVMDRIGISGEESGYRTQDPARLSEGAERLRRRYQDLKPDLRARFRMRQPLMALLTDSHRGRDATAYRDLDYYATGDSAIYRARYTIEELERRENFQYMPGWIVQTISSEGDMRVVLAKNFSGSAQEFRAKRIVLAAGAVNTNRIVLRSGMQSSSRLFVKPNHILPCLDWCSIGTKDNEPRHSLCQLTIERSDAAGRFFAHVYTYRSLLLWKLKEHIPLAAPEALSLLALYAPSLFLVDARTPGEGGQCELSIRDGVLMLHRISEDIADRLELSDLKKFLRKLGLFALQTTHPSLGASVHYAGGLETEENAEMRGYPGIYIADSASWKSLPPKPPALTLMANADRVGKEILKSL